MAFELETFARAAFKVGQGLAHTTNTRDPANEAEASAFTLAAQELFAPADGIPSDPDTAVANGDAVFISLELTQDVGNTLSYFANLSTVVGTPLEGLINPRTGEEYGTTDYDANIDGYRVGFMIPPKFGVDYRAILRDNGTEVPPLSAEDWFFDYRAGIVTSETALGLGSTGTIDGYVYVGDFVSDRLDAISSSVLDGYAILGNTDVELPGTVRFNGREFQGYDGYQWRNLSNDESHISVGTLTDSSGQGTVTFNPFSASIYSSFVRDTDWEFNSTGGTVTYLPDDGYFVVEATGAYRIDASLIFSQISAGSDHVFELLKNGQQFWTGIREVDLATDPIEVSIIVIEDLQVGDIVELLVTNVAGTTTVQDGSVFNMSMVGVDHSSTTILTSASVTTDPYNMFSADAHAGFVKGTNWDHNSVPQNITYTPDDGYFTVNKDGSYKIDLNYFYSTGTTDITTTRIRLNDSTTYSAATGNVVTSQPQEKTLSVIKDLSEGDVISFTTDSINNSTVAQPGSTANFQRISGERRSQSILTASNAQSTQFTVWRSNVYPSFTENTDWRQNAAARDIDYAVGGFFTVQNHGLYHIEQRAFFSVAVGLNVTQTIRVNGIDVYTNTILVNSATDPQECSMSVLLELNPLDEIIILAEPSASTMTVQPATTINITRVLDEDAQTGPWSIAGPGTDLYYLNGNVGIGTPLPTSLLHLLGSATSVTIESTGNATVDIQSEADSIVTFEAADSSSLIVESNSGGGSPSTRRPYISINDNFNNPTILGLNQASGVAADTSFVTGALTDAFMIHNGISLNYIQFATDDAVRMTLDDSGNVGIGTTSPNEDLEVAAAAGGNIAVCRDDTTILNGDRIGTFHFRGNDGPTVGAKIWAEADADWTSVNDASTVIRMGAQDGGAGSTVDTPKLTISDSGVTIGDLTSPNSGLFNAPNLHVHKNTAGTVTANANTVITAENSTDAWISILSPAADQAGILFGSPTSAQQGGVVYDHANDSLAFRNDGNVTRMTIETGGQVGIGVTVPEALLHISGATPFFEIENTSETESGILMYDSAAKTTQFAQLGYNASVGELNFWVDNSVSPVMTLEDNTTGTDPRVGINTTTPDVMLQISNDASTTVPTLGFEDTDTAAASNQVAGRIDFRTNDTTDPGIAARIQALATSSTGNLEIQFYTGGASNLDEKMAVGSGSDGGVGISAHEGAPPNATSGVSLTLGTASGNGSRGYLAMNANTVPADQEMTFLRMDQHDGGNQYIWVDNSAATGDLRISSTNPVDETNDTSGTIVGTQSFTGFHFYPTEATIDFDSDDGYDGYLTVGDAVALSEDGYVVRSSSPQQSNVIGLFCGFTTNYRSSLDDRQTSPAKYWSETEGFYYGDPTRDGYIIEEADVVELAVISSLGDARDFSVAGQLMGFSVCDEGGAIKAGDLLCSSSTYGYLMKQSDDIMHSYTVGKALEGVTFDGDGRATGIYGYIYCG